MLQINNNFKITKIKAAAIMQNEKNEEILSGAYDCFELLFVNSGKVTVTLNGDVFECISGTAIIFSPDDMHYISLQNDVFTEYTVISFLAEGDIPEMPKAPVSLTVLQKQLLLSVYNQISEDKEYNTILPSVFNENNLAVLKLAATTQLIVLELAGNKATLSKNETRDTLLFKEAVEKMNDKVLEQLSVGDLADDIGISLSHLKRIFASFTDVGVHEYYMALKVEEAKKMLKEGISVTETAEKAGFNNQNYFSAAFKRIAGVSPKEYSGTKVKKYAPQKTVRIVEKEVAKPKQKTATDMPSYLL